MIKKKERIFRFRDRKPPSKRPKPSYRISYYNIAMANISNYCCLSERHGYIIYYIILLSKASVGFTTSGEGFTVA